MQGGRKAKKRVPMRKSGEAASYAARPVPIVFLSARSHPDRAGYPWPER